MPRKPPIPISLGEVESGKNSSLIPKGSGVLLASSRSPRGGGPLGIVGMPGLCRVGDVVIEKMDSWRWNVECWDWGRSSGDMESSEESGGGGGGDSGGGMGCRGGGVEAGGEVGGVSSEEDERGGEGAGSSGGGGLAVVPSVKLTQLDCNSSDSDLGLSDVANTLSMSERAGPTVWSDNRSS